MTGGGDDDPDPFQEEWMFFYGAGNAVPLADNWE